VSGDRLVITMLALGTVTLVFYENGSVLMLQLQDLSMHSGLLDTLIHSPVEIDRGIH
jgi:hypothetical protein